MKQRQRDKAPALVCRWNLFCTCSHAQLTHVRMLLGSLRERLELRAQGQGGQHSGQSQGVADQIWLSPFPAGPGGAALSPVLP